MLWGIDNHRTVGESCIFKGGTCLKKCFFETYRFSEDLDFTLVDASHVDEDFLKSVFSDVAERIYEETGIEFPPDARKFDIHKNPRGRLRCQARIGYRGPVSPRGRNVPRIKLDLTADERVVLPGVRSRVFHPYSGEPEGGIAIRSYPYEEAFGEKVRALAERARPRDLYDVINLFRNAESRPAAAVLLDIIGQNCAFKGMSLPILAHLEPQRPILEGNWNQMLAHQLPILPPFATFWDELPIFFDWLQGGVAPRIPAAYVAADGEQTIRERTMRLPLTGQTQSYLEVIRFAASNRLCVDLRYRGLTRRVEPYSLRRTKDSNIILHAHDRDKNDHRSYRVNHIEGANVTDESFNPTVCDRTDARRARQHCAYGQKSRFGGCTTSWHDHGMDACGGGRWWAKRWSFEFKRTDVCLRVCLLRPAVLAQTAGVLAQSAQGQRRLRLSWPTCRTGRYAVLAGGDDDLSGRSGARPGWDPRRHVGRSEHRFQLV